MFAGVPKNSSYATVGCRLCPSLSCDSCPIHTLSCPALLSPALSSDNVLSWNVNHALHLRPQLSATSAFQLRQRLCAERVKPVCACSTDIHVVVVLRLYFQGINSVDHSNVVKESEAVSTDVMRFVQIQLITRMINSQWIINIMSSKSNFANYASSV